MIGYILVIPPAWYGLHWDWLLAGETITSIVHENQVETSSERTSWYENCHSTLVKWLHGKIGIRSGTGPRQTRIEAQTCRKSKAKTAVLNTQAHGHGNPNLFSRHDAGQFTDIPPFRPAMKIKNGNEMTGTRKWNAPRPILSWRDVVNARNNMM